MPPVLKLHNTERPVSKATDIIDPQVAIGGALFLPAAEGFATQNAVAKDPAKPFKLTATLEGNPDVARALIETQGDGTREYCAATESCRRGDCVCVVQDAKVVQIAKEQIWLRSGSTRYSLRIGQSSTEALASQPVKDLQGAQTKTVIPKASPISQTISRENVIKILQGKEGPILDGQFGPHVVDGRITGYKIVRIGEDHIFAKLGAKSGDIIRKVNGYPLDGMERLLDIWKALPTALEIKIDLERNGRPMSYEFQIRK